MVGFRSAFAPAEGKLPPAPEPKPQAERDSGDVVLKTCPPDMVEIRPKPGTRAFELVNYPFCIDRYEYPNKENQLPKARLTWEEADRMARALGRRLPTRNEWRVACGGDDLWKYPFGEEYIPGRGPVELDQKEPVPSGSMPGSKSPFGVFDLSGNLAEWLWSGPAGPGACGGIAGGCWFSVRENATSSSWVDQKPGDKGPTIGFRCAARLEK
jgi:formylglycine-generating enzyme required for sulfatase activity